MINTFIDESGSFAEADFVGAWNVTAVLVIPNPELRKSSEILRRLKVRSGVNANEEIKLREISDINYLRFLTELSKTRCTLYSVATDSGLQSSEAIAAHRNVQAEKIVEHIDKMIYPQGAQGLRNLAGQVRDLSPQLHLQLVCQVELIADVIDQCILYYVQRSPTQLNGFRWRIDQKAPGTNNFEKTFRIIVPPVLQSKSLKTPGIHVVEFDYSAMSQFLYTKRDAPTYLKDHYDIDINLEGALKLSKLVWGDFEFVDSKMDNGVQLADLLASGLRRCLRGSFSDNTKIASALGKIMVQIIDHGYPIRFITLSGREGEADKIAAEVSSIFRRQQRQMMR